MTRRRSWWRRSLRVAALAVLTLVCSASAASAQSSPGTVSPEAHRSPSWYESGGMTLDSPGSARSTSSLQQLTGYDGTISPPGVLFEDPSKADDPWHFLPATRSPRTNDFFSTGEGGLLAIAHNFLSASWTTLIAMAFTFSSLLWTINIWLMRMMVGAPTLAAEFMSRISGYFGDLAGAVFKSGWPAALIMIAVLVGAWRLGRHNEGPGDFFRRLFAAVLPMAVVSALLVFTVDAKDAAGQPILDSNGDPITVSGPEWVFATNLRLASLISEPVQALSDALTSDVRESPDQLVTCDAYLAVLEANFIRAWNTEGGAHLEGALYRNADGTFVSAAAALVYDWAKSSDALRMRTALKVSRIWERAYASGYGQVQFGDPITAERAWCLIADWRNRDVSALEMLAIWRETCFLRAFSVGGPSDAHGSLLFGDNMALAGCFFMPQIRSSAQIGGPTAHSRPLTELAIMQFYLVNNDRNGECSDKRRGRNPAWSLPTSGSTTNQAACVAAWVEHYSTERDQDWRVIVFRVSSTLTSAEMQQVLSQPLIYSPTQSGGRTSGLRDVESYAAAVFTPANRISADGDRFALRTLHGAWSACEFTDWHADEYINELGDIRRANSLAPPRYPTHGGVMPADGDEVLIPAEIRILPDSQSGSVPIPGNSIRVDARMWGLGFDGVGYGGKGQAEEIITPTACAAYLFGSGLNNMDGPPGADLESTKNTATSGGRPTARTTAVWYLADLGIFDQSRGYGEEFRWDQGRYPPAGAWLTPGDPGSAVEYPGANNWFARNRLGRTPEEYLDSAALFPLSTNLSGASSNTSSAYFPTLSQSHNGADVFQAIHGRRRAESGLIALVTVIVAILYLMSFAGLFLGAALSGVILALLVSTLPITLLFSALPFEKAREIPKRLLKVGFGASVSYSVMLLFISFVLMFEDLVHRVVLAIGFQSGNVWYSILLALTPLIALFGGGMLFKHFGVNPLKAKGAFSLTAGTAWANIKEPSFNSARRYSRMGMSSLAYGSMMRGGAYGSGSAMRTAPATAAAGGAALGGAAAGAMASGAGSVASSVGSGIASVGRESKAAMQGGAAGASGPPAPRQRGSLAQHAARVISPRGEQSGQPGRVSRAVQFARSHPALVGSAALLPLGGIGAAGAWYVAGKAGRMSGASSMARAMMGMPRSQRASSETDRQWAGGHIRAQRQRVAGWLDPSADSLGQSTAPPPMPAHTMPSASGSSPTASAASSSTPPAPPVRFPCWVPRNDGSRCDLPAEVCIQHTDADRAAVRQQMTSMATQPSALGTSDPYTALAHTTSLVQEAAMRGRGCRAPVPGGGMCLNPAGNCEIHPRRPPPQIITGVR